MFLHFRLPAKSWLAARWFAAVFLAGTFVVGCGGGGGGGGSSATSAPVITTQPVSATALDGATVSFSVAASGDALQYRWRKNGVDVAGGTTPTLTTPASYADNGAAFTVVVSNRAGLVTSDAATLTVTPIPVTITAQPQPASILDGEAAMLSVTATGTAPLQYQWRRGAANIAGATSSSFTTPALALADNGADYSVMVSNPAGGVASAAAIVTVAPAPPAIVSSPQAVTTADGGTVQFAVTATGTAPLSYQWLRNGAPIGGATTPTYTFAAAFADNGASYSVRVSNFVNSAVSGAALLTVNPLAPAIVQQPQPRNAVVGAPVSFTANATGTAPISFQWQRSLDRGTTWSDIAGATTQTLAFNATFADFDTRYRAIVTNPVATVQSLAATLMVRADLKLLSGALGGGGYLDGSGDEVRLGISGYGITAAAGGDIFFNDFGMIRRVTTSGQVSTFVGKFNTGGAVDGQGTEARLTWPFAQAIDAAGNVYTTDIAMIRKVTPSGQTTTIAGRYFEQGSDDGPIATARFGAAMFGLAVDGAGNVFVADTDSHTIRVISSGGIVTTLAGTAGQAGATDGNGAAARFRFPRGIALDAAGNLIVADADNHTIRRVTPAGEVTTVAGGAGVSGLVDDDGLAARFASPSGVAVDAAQNIYVADTRNSVIRRITPAGTVTTFAGGTRGWADDIGALARFRSPAGIAYAAASQSLLVYDTFNFALRRIPLNTAAVTTVAGVAPRAGHVDGPRANARFDGPVRMALGPDGTLYIADRSNFVIRTLSPAGDVGTLAGTPGVSGNVDGTGSAALFASIGGISVDTAGVVYVTDNQSVRRIAPGGVVTTLAGLPGVPGADDGAGNAALFFNPEDIAVDAGGILYVSDTANHTIRRVTPSGVVTTHAGMPGVRGAQDGQGFGARFDLPQGLTLDADGNLYVADTGNHAIRRVTPAGDVTTHAGALSSPGSRDDLVSLARFNQPYDLAFDARGHLYVTELGNSVVRRVSTAGRVDTVIGEADRRGVRLGQQALVNQPQGIVVLPSGRLVITSENSILGD